MVKRDQQLRNSRLKFGLEKLKDPATPKELLVALGGTFDPLLLLEEDLEAMNNNFTEVLTETTNEVLGKS